MTKEPLKRRRFTLGKTSDLDDQIGAISIEIETNNVIITKGQILGEKCLPDFLLNPLQTVYVSVYNDPYSDKNLQSRRIFKVQYTNSSWKPFYLHSISESILTETLILYGCTFSYIDEHLSKF